MVIELTLQSTNGVKDGVARHECKPALFVIEGNVVITSTNKGYSKLVFPDIGTGRGWVVQESYEEIKDILKGGN